MERKRLDCLLISFGICPEYRGKGLGKYLLSKTLSAMRDMECSIVTLNTSAKDKAAVQLYKKFGFKGHKWYHKETESFIWRMQKLLQ